MTALSCEPSEYTLCDFLIPFFDFFVIISFEPKVADGSNGSNTSKFHISITGSKVPMNEWIIEINYWMNVRN